MNKNYIDYESKNIRMLASKLMKGTTSEEEKLFEIFYFVRDEIKFAFLREADFLAASQVLEYKKGQCNNKSILFHTLCKIVGIKSRIHFSTIKKEIHFGIFEGIVYSLLPNELSHSWIDVNINGDWIKIDNYVNDIEFYNNGKATLRKKGLVTGYSVSCDGADSSADLNLNEGKYVQMNAIVTDHGTYDDPNEYFNSSKYKNRPNKIRMFIYRLAIKKVNIRINNIRFNSF